MPVASLTSVTKRYPGLSAPALDDVSLAADDGEITIVVGANGSGKTTAMEILSGLRVPDAGSVTFLDRPVVPGGEHRRQMGVQLQNGGLPQRLKVREAISAVTVLHADPGPVDEVVAALGLDERLDQMVDKLSGGWQRRLDVALACLGRPRLVILDEPTSGLDPVARAELWEFLRGLRHRGVSILASTHDLTEAEAFADRLVVLERGRIVVQGSVTDVLEQAGGSHRLRVTGAGPEVAAAVAAAGHRPLQRGDSISVLGEAEEMVALRTRLESARDTDGLRFTDVMTGPVRLEDVFAFALTAREESR